jgi:hypothetical protein
MVTFTMLAESKCEDPLSEQVIPAPGSSTHTATVEERPRRAAWMSRASAAATAGCDFDVHTTVAAAKLAAVGFVPAALATAGLAADAAGASTGINDLSSMTIAVTSSPCRDFLLESGVHISRLLDPSACRAL